MSPFPAPARLYLFERLKLQGPDGEPLVIRSAKLASLLGYLIWRAGQPLSRSELAQILWPHQAASSARRNLREYLYRGRQVFSRLWPDESVLVTEEDQVTFLPPDSSRYWVDIWAFQQHIQKAEQASSAAARIPHLQAAWRLYRGDLLASLDDPWLLGPRAQFRRQAILALESLARAFWEQKQVEAAIETAQHGVSFEPYHEPYWAQLIQWLYEAGREEEARAWYQRYETWLQRELGLTPDSTMLALGQRIQQPASLQPAFATSPEQPSSSPAVDFVPPFVGRRSELLRLRLALQERRQSPIDTFIILGASGVGKTRLMHEWRQEIQNRALVLEGRGHEFEQSIPYLPLLDAIQPALSLTPWDQLPPATSYAWLAPLAQLLPDLHYHVPNLPPYPAATDSDTAHYIMEGLAQIMLVLARQRPLVLLIDDLHWADRSTWGFLPFISRRMRGLPFLIVVTFSTTEADEEAHRRLRALQRDRHVQSLPLSLLWPNEVTRLIPPELRKDIAAIEPFALKLHQLTQGNPFFVTEILRALLESDLPRPYTAESLEQLRLPDAVKSLIQLRLARLPLESRRVLCMAAAIGREFTISLLVRISGLDDDTLLSYLDDWLRRGLVVETSGGYDFNQQQIRDVAYQSLSRSRRRRIHRRIAQALAQEKSPNIERVTQHYTLSDTPEQAIPGLLWQGQRALNLRSYREAQLVGDTLLSIIQQAPEAAEVQDQVTLTIQLGLAYAFRRETDQALTLLERAAKMAEQCRDRKAAVQALLRIAQIHWLRGDASRARIEVTRCLGKIQKEPDTALTEWEAAAWRLLGRVHIAQGRYADAAQALEKALALTGEGPEQRLNRITAQGYLITAYGRLGKAQEVQSLARTLDQATRQLGSPSLRGVILVQMAVAFNALDQWQEASRWARVGMRLCEEQALPVYVFVAKTVLARAEYFLKKDREQAYRMLYEAIHWAQTHDYWLFRFMAHVFLAEIARDQGDEATLAAQLIALKQGAQRTGNLWALEVVQGYMGDR